MGTRNPLVRNRAAVGFHMLIPTVFFFTSLHGFSSFVMVSSSIPDSKFQVSRSIPSFETTSPLLSQNTT